MSEAIQAFIKAQSEMGSAIKNAKNPFLKNKYADINAIQDAVHPVFHANGFMITQEGSADEFGQYVETKLTHTTGQSFSSKVYLEFKKSDMQSLGGAITYARRYGLVSLTGIPVEDDDANTANGMQHMQMKQAAKKAKNGSREERLLERGEKLVRTLKNCTQSQLLTYAPEATTLIEEIRLFDNDVADSLDNIFKDREAELGLTQ
tara:strand:- start:299 stop:913 length:615 start_codon:yes stop_codon:yes gene_type:complete